MAPAEPSTSPSPNTMKAWAHSTTGLPAQVLHLKSDIKIPELKPDEVLVQVSYAAINPGGVVIMNLVPFFFRTKPSIPEMDLAGTIIASSPTPTNPSSRNLQIGTRVFGNIPVGLHVNKGYGSLAEYVAVPSDCVCPIPEGMKVEEAAGLGITGCSALALMDRAKGLKAGDRVLINGASGGIGTLLVQMVKEKVGKEGEVVALCSGRNVDVVKGLGADEVIDYQKHDPLSKYLTEHFKNDQFDWIIEAYGSQDLWLHCDSYLKPGKPFITIGLSAPGYNWSNVLCWLGQTMSNSLKPRFLGGVNRPYAQTNGIASLKDMERLVRMVEEGKLKVLIDSIWSFDDVLQAYEKSMSKHARGKIIIHVEHTET